MEETHTSPIPIVDANTLQIRGIFPSLFCLDRYLFIGTGVSGGEEGARYGPSLLPGGHPDAWPHVKKIFQSVAAQTDGQPCCDWVGEEGAGHYVKMVHNGIEYGDMQLICEVH
jgi:6-phosphogluconate dehydrogenase